MNSIQIPGNPMQLELLLSKEEIAEKIKTIASLLDREYENKEIIIVMILKGSIFFVSDLIRSLHMPVRLETIHCTSYGEHGMKRGELKITGLDSLDLEGKHVLLVDDILDSGITISQVIEGIQKHHPKTLLSLVLLTKKSGQTNRFCSRSFPL